MFVGFNSRHYSMNFILNLCCYNVGIANKNTNTPEFMIFQQKSNVVTARI